MALYSFSHSIDIASTDAFANYLNTPGGSAYQSVDRGDSDFDIRHSFTAGVTYDLPSPASQKVVHALLGSWSLDTFLIARSALPVDVVCAIYFASGTALYPRPNVNPGVPLVLYGSQHPGGKIFKARLSANRPPGSKVTSGATFCVVSLATQANVALQRQFQFTEKVCLRFRAEFFNTFNHPNFGPPTGDLTSPKFGYSTQ